MQTTKEVNPHLHSVPCVNMWSGTFLFLISSSYATCDMLVHPYATSPRNAKWSGSHHYVKMLHFVLFHNVTCYIDSIVSRIHVNTTKFPNIMRTLVATCVIAQSLECTQMGPTSYKSSFKIIQVCALQ